MYRRFGWGLLVLCSIGFGAGLLGPHRSAGADNASVASVDQLETQAANALRQGNFDRGSDLLTQAAHVDPDPGIQSLADSAASFRKLEQTFADQRQTEFEKNIRDLHLLIDHGMRTYAVDLLEQAYLRAPDKDAFRKEKWVDDLVNSAATEAQTAEANAQWVTALRIYADLTTLDPFKPVWKDKLKLVTRRIRLVMVYAPDQFKAIEKIEMDAHKKADDLLHPTTQPVAAVNPADDQNDGFKLDWHEAVHGATLDMLLSSLTFADHDYFRTVDMQALLNGGIDALRTMATTKGLDQTFTGLGNADKEKDFLWALDQASIAAKQINADNEDDVIHNILTTLLDADHDTVNLPDEVFVSEFTNGALDQLDPFSSMIWPYDLPEFMQTTQGELIGVGIQIESAEDGSLRVVSPLEDTPAYKAGIKAGDIITHIDGKSAHGISINQAVKSITGIAHTTVVLTVRSLDGSTHTYPIERQIINVVSVKGYRHMPGGGWSYFVDPDSKIAYLRMTNFTAKTGDELRVALDDLNQQGARGLILDLRANPGGLLTAAVDVASQFIRKGVVVSTHPDRDTENRPTVVDAEPDAQTTDMPLAILVNQYSASASEIVAGALKDHGRATIVGERTFGKGSVQILFPLADKTAFLKLTTSHYYLPSGRCLHRDENSTVWGVDPDVKVELTPEQMGTSIEVRKEMEVLHDVGSAATQPSSKIDLLSADPQLSAAVLVLRLKLAGVQI
jgi:carboxyl-terminal processing protease